MRVDILWVRVEAAVSGDEEGVMMGMKEGVVMRMKSGVGDEEWCWGGWM